MKNYLATTAMQWLAFTARKGLTGVTPEESRKVFSGQIADKALAWVIGMRAVEVRAGRLCVTAIGQEILQSLEKKAGKEACRLHLGSIGVERN